jgi:hypothetical protein
MNTVRELTETPRIMAPERAVYSREYMRTIAYGACSILLIQLVIPERVTAAVFEAVMLVLLMLSVSPTHEYCDVSTPWRIMEIMLMNARILIEIVVDDLGRRLPLSSSNVVKWIEGKVASQFERLLSQLLMVAVGHDDTADSGDVSLLHRSHQQQPSTAAIHHLPLATVMEESPCGDNDESDAWHIM